MGNSAWVFLTDRADGHADRFYRLFYEAHPGCERLDVAVDHDGTPRATRNGTALTSWDGIRDSLAGSALVISGPLDTVSHHLSSDTYRHVGISWATDLMVSAAASQALATSLEGAVASMDLVVTDNYATENAFVSMGVEPDKIVRIPWGPQPFEATGKPISGSDVRKRLEIPDGKRVVLYPRALEPHYEPLVFIEALSTVAAEYPDVCAVIVESGSLVPAVKTAVSDTGLEGTVFWAPTLESPEFHALIRDSALVVVSPRTDGTSVTVMEAMSLGTPVVTSQTSGSAEWVMDGVTGWSFPVGSPAGLYSAMARVFGASESEISSITTRAKRLVDSRAGWSRSSAILSKALQAL